MHSVYTSMLRHPRTAYTCNPTLYLTIYDTIYMVDTYVHTKMHTAAYSISDVPICVIRVRIISLGLLYTYYTNIIYTQNIIPYLITIQLLLAIEITGKNPINIILINFDLEFV
jgi:hypothetical protein